MKLDTYKENPKEKEGLLTRKEFDKLIIKYPKSYITFDKVQHLTEDYAEMAICNLHYRYIESPAADCKGNRLYEMAKQMADKLNDSRIK